MYAVNNSFFTSSSIAGTITGSISELPADYSYFPPFNSDDSNDQLADKITTLAGQINAANYRFLKMIAEFDRRVAWEGPGIRSCAYWLHWKCGIDIGAAREKVRAARALEGLPEINEAFEKGELSYSKVRAMTRVATEENESYLLNIAQHGTTQHVEKLVGAYRTVSRCEDFAGADLIGVMGEVDESVVVSELEVEKRREQALYDSRAVSCYQEDDGMWIIKAKLPAVEGALLVKLLKELGDRIAAPKNNAEGSEKKVSAETFSDYKKDDLAKDELLDELNEELKEELKEEKLTFPQRRADALMAIAEGFLAHSDESALFSNLKGHERCQLVLHVQHANNGVAGPQDNLDGRWLLPDAARRLACDASLLVVEKDSMGNVLDIGRKTRIIPVAMSRALSIRDGGCCQFPGCCESHYVEGHHIKHWADGGDTKLDNLVTLCRYHHRELHKGSFFLSLKPASTDTKDDKPVRFVERLCFSKVDRYFDAPFNRSEDFVIAVNPAKFTCACCDPVKFEETLPRTIDEKTAVTKWAEESMDLGMAVNGLLNTGKRWKHGLN